MNLRLLTALCVFSLILAFPNPITEVEEGDDVVLQCLVDGGVDVSGSPVTWSKDVHKNVVHALVRGRDQTEDQKEEFRNRTWLLREDLRTGNVSLRLSSVRMSDTGTYTCYLPRLNVLCPVDLKVVERGQLVRQSISDTTTSSLMEHVPKTDTPAGENRTVCDVKYTVISIFVGVLGAVILLILGTFMTCKKIQAKMEQKEAERPADAEMQTLRAKHATHAAGGVQDVV